MNKLLQTLGTKLSEYPITDLGDEAQKEREACIEALTPILGRQDAEIAVALDDDIRSSNQRDFKQAIAEAGGGFIRDRLREVSFARKILPPTRLLNTPVLTKKEV